MGLCRGGGGGRVPVEPAGQRAGCAERLGRAERHVDPADGAGGLDVLGFRRRGGGGLRSGSGRGRPLALAELIWLLALVGLLLALAALPVSWAVLDWIITRHGVTLAD
jgi:hypothetical protein